MTSAVCLIPCWSIPVNIRDWLSARPTKLPYTGETAKNPLIIRKKVVEIDSGTKMYEISSMKQK